MHAHATAARPDPAGTYEVPAATASEPRREPAPHWRVGDDERAQACEALAVHHTLGRLDHAECDRRLTAAVRAVTRADLDALFADLPPVPAPAAASPAPQPSRFAALADLAKATAGITALGAMGIVVLMIMGSTFLGQGVFFFTLVGGTLTAYMATVLTWLACGGRGRAAESPTPAAARAAVSPAR